jgi:hypothetical protein
VGLVEGTVVLAATDVVGSVGVADLGAGCSQCIVHPDGQTSREGLGDIFDQNLALAAGYRKLKGHNLAEWEIC